MILYYTFQDINGGSFPDKEFTEIWRADFHLSVNIGEMKNKLAIWHLLVSSSLKIFNSFQSGEESGYHRLESCIEFPLIVSVDTDQNQETSPTAIAKEFPITHVLLYLLTRDQKYKPKLASR
jgi:hypothetical protein